MKQATCKQLRGACDTVITGENPEEIGEKCREHVMDMVDEDDQAHIDALEAMKKVPKSELIVWYSDFVKNFDNLKDA